MSHDTLLDTTNSVNTALGVMFVPMGGNTDRTGSTQENYAVAFTAKNNQKVAFIDFNDPGGYGYGQAVLSEKRALTPVDLENSVGKWFMVSLVPGGNSGVAVVTVEPNARLTTVQPDGSSESATAVPNTPWDGFSVISNSSDSRVLMGGNGFYSMTRSNDLAGKAKYFIGMKMN